ncbi:ABC transporter ATP-binding protein [Pseudomonas sp. 5P_3.1_Bac2]|uniref:ABC transporter ATP-binding protein n=1 Tax=Pseudomonas sp. 5P_3.1_Bac2 TaxID=2971617 RepID=UPI0021C7E775|nr:ABC transporter ATP-binding protein [Pseudomonas sp. 5P_3.1_Bac2]MCU1717150.1 ABC transporter ATP-binding protein/permease [Pseudomonas sp. 5P_3.1_Bac2]
MLSTFKRLLGSEVSALRRYLSLALLYGLLCGVSILLVLPMLNALLQSKLIASLSWLLALLLASLLCWRLRVRVEKAGIAVGIAVLSSGRNQLGEHVAQLPIGWFNPANTARLSHVSSQGMMEIAQLPAHVFTPVLTGIISPLVMLVGLFALNWQAGLLALMGLPLLAGLFVLTAALGQRADQRYHLAAANSSQRMVEFAQAQSVLRAFNGAGSSTGLLNDALAEQEQSAKQLIRISAMSVLLNAWAVQGLFALLLLVLFSAINQLLATDLDLPAVSSAIVALLLVSRLVDPLLEVAGYADVLRGSRNQLQAVADIFAVQPLPEPAVSQHPADASVQLQDVSFAYAAEQAPVLKGLSLRIEADSMTALVGASGSGKSTLLKLIARFFEVSGGSVKIGAVDVRQMDSAQLASQISQIFQDTYLFQGSIADNIRLGRPDASLEQVQEAAEAAGLASMLANLPEGLDSPVGAGGAKLSGGERQRIAIARALIKQAPILLVDEATAALDAENQALIAQTLARLKGRCTLIVIAHQLSTVAMADQIIVLDQGRVAEQGTPQQLAANNGLYAHFLAQRQASKGWQIAAVGSAG